MANKATDTLVFGLQYFKDRIIGIRSDFYDKVEKTFKEQFKSKRIPSRIEDIYPLIKSGEVVLEDNIGRYWDLDDKFRFVDDGGKKEAEKVRDALTDKVKEESRKAMDLVILSDADPFVKLQEFEAWTKTLEIKFE